MSNVARPDPIRRWLLIFLWLIVLLVAAGGLYADATLGKPPRWLEFASRMNGAIIGSAIWLGADFYGSSSVWWRGLAILLFAVTALTLILFFV